MANLTNAELTTILVAQKARWTSSDNPIAMLSPAMQNRLLGREKPGEITADNAAATRGGAAVSFDPAVDWRNRNGVNHISPVKDQVSCGSCVSFCTVGVTEAMAHIEKNVWLDLSEADQHFCSSHGATCGGWNDAAGFDQIKSRGVCDEASFPYATAFPNNNPGFYYGRPEPVEPPHPTCRVAGDRNARAVKITNIINHQANLANQKSHLTNVGPISCSIAVYDDFFGYHSGVYHHVTGVLRGYHCIAIVGYSEQEQCWICKNSWGTSWGMSGYFKMGYGQCGIDQYEKIGVTGVIIPNPKHEVNKVMLQESSSFAPAIAQQGGKVFLAWTGTGNNQLNVVSSVNGTAFANKVTLADTAVGSPAIAAHNGVLYMAWTGTDARRSLNVMSSTDGVHWGNKATLADTSFCAPALASFNGKLYMAWTGTDARHSLNIMSSADGHTFGGKMTFADTSFTSPALTAVGGLLYMGWAGTNSTHNLNTMYSRDGISFINKITYPETSGASPALSNDGAVVWMNWNGTGNLQINFLTQPSAFSKITLGETAIGGSAMSYPYFAWTGTDGLHHLNVAKLA